MNSDKHHDADKLQADVQHVAEWQDRLNDLLDASLSAGEATDVQTHLAACPHCRLEYARLQTLDAQLRSDIVGDDQPAADFDSRVLSRIATLDQTQRTLARQREQVEFEACLARLRSGWRSLLRFHMGNVLGGIVTVAAIAASLVALVPRNAHWTADKLGNELAASNVLGPQVAAWLPQHSDFMWPIAAVAASLAIAGATLLLARRTEH